MYIERLKLPFKRLPLTRQYKSTCILLLHSGDNELTVNDLHNNHLRRGKSGIGSHFCIDGDGNIYQTRDLAVKSESLLNYGNSIVITLLGDYFVNDEIPEHQLKSCKDLIYYIKKQDRYVAKNASVKTINDVTKVKLLNNTKLFNKNIVSSLFLD